MSETDVSLAPLKVGMLGLSIDAISAGEWGYVHLPLGVRDSTVAGGREWVRVKIRALESIRAERDIIVANVQGDVKEHTPVELSYQTVTGTTIGPYQRVTEAYPLPVTDAYEYDDYAEITVASTETSYTIGTNAKAGDASLPNSFEAKTIMFRADCDFYIRFNGSTRVQHRFQSGTYFSINRRVTTIYVQLYGGAGGTLQMWAVG